MVDEMNELDYKLKDYELKEMRWNMNNGIDIVAIVALHLLISSAYCMSVSVCVDCVMTELL